MTLSRKDFIARTFWAGSGFVVLSRTASVAGGIGGNQAQKVIVADYDKCTGCRTCEAICSAFHQEEKNPHNPGNHENSNIRVWRFMPPLDVPISCYLCHDAPCVAACPVSVSAQTGHKALYRDKITNAITCDRDRCIGCQSCADTCRTHRAGIIFPDQEGSPAGMCDLCNGDPQCVQWCPYEALSYLERWPDAAHPYPGPDAVYERLKQKYYPTQSE